MNSTIFFELLIHGPCLNSSPQVLPHDFAAAASVCLSVLVVVVFVFVFRFVLF